MTNKEYHAHPAINRSRLFRIHEKSPQWFKYCEDNPPTPAPMLEFGSAFHCIVLEPGQFVKQFAIFPDGDKRTKEGKAEYEAFKAGLRGRTAITKPDYEKLKAMHDSVVARKDAKVLLKGEIEQPIFWHDEITGEECKCKPDVLTVLPGAKVCVDLKSCANASTDSFMRDAIKYGYDVEAAMYLDGVKHETGEDYEFVFIAVEKTPPYAVNIIAAGPYFIDYGKHRYRKLMEIYHDCKTTGNWYGYNGKKGSFNELEIPNWCMKELKAMNE